MFLPNILKFLCILNGMMKKFYEKSQRKYVFLKNTIV